MQMISMINYCMFTGIISWSTSNVQMLFATFKSYITSFQK